jgi:peroxiredoxin
MNLLKSVFVPTFMTLLMVVTGYATWRLAQGAPALPWAGVLLTTAPFLLLLGWVMAFKSLARTSPRFPWIMALGVAGTALAATGLQSQDAGLPALALALLGLAGFLVYAFWYSTYQDRPKARVALGQPLPAFAVTGPDGRPVTSAQLTDRPAILMFYRGNWCPFCIAQVKELVQRYQQLKALGVRVALISPQPHGNTLDLANQFQVDFEFLTDTGNAAARVLGIDHPHGLPMGMQALGYDSETVLPTVIITDGAGRVLWTHETDNYRVRPEPGLFLEVLRGHGGVGSAA